MVWHGRVAFGPVTDDGIAHCHQPAQVYRVRPGATTSTGQSEIPVRIQPQLTTQRAIAHPINPIMRLLGHHCLHGPVICNRPSPQLPGFRCSDYRSRVECCEPATAARPMSAMLREDCSNR